MPPIRQGVPAGYVRKPVDYVPPQADPAPDLTSVHADDPPPGWPTSVPWWPAGNPNRTPDTEALEREILSRNSTDDQH
ncbi:hypothetical protein XA26_45720 [Mycolicibacterium fortuitum]|uniref:Uncharacterized protein n=1 Tax=Mycolicibacterium fortuitum TaxID=1766 RepID=A0A0N9XWB1_MYCFO|nr:hypothetical protein XA26_45720 [Mycolicibacterium fortuitum]